METTQTAIEQRGAERTEIMWPVSIWLPDARRFINGHSSNVSSSGVYVKVPVTTPVREGNFVEINFPRTETLAKEKGGYARIKLGKVVRVERKDLVKCAEIGFAIHFEK